ncbi:MAG: hypothetical protein NWE77_02775 [Candidatus Bathyarchaeota archaeon]|nr:hypothetical protein [Candidatus Bathyarchaeota archaeon]
MIKLGDLVQFTSRWPYLGEKDEYRDGRVGIAIALSLGTDHDRCKVLWLSGTRLGEGEWVGKGFLEVISPAKIK